PGLSAERITLVDDRGNLLARGGDGDDDGIVAGETEEFRTTYENRVKRTIEELLARSLGPDRVRAQVHAEMDFDRVTTTEETYDPDGRVVRSTQNVEEESAASERDQDENVTVGNNLPNTDPADAAARTSNETTTRSEETVNYEISRTVRNHIQVGGRVRRLSVAVLVDGRMVPDDDGNLVYAELDQDELAQIETLVRSAVGFDEARGDVVEIINMPFDVPPAVELEQPWLDIDKHDLLRLIELLVLAVVALVLIMFVIRPAVRHFAAESDQALAMATAGGGAAALEGSDPGIPGQPALAGPAGAAGSAAARGGAATSPAALSGPSMADLEAEADERIDLDQVKGGVSKVLLERAMSACDESPDDVIRIVRTWLHEDWTE
ncbi:MAG: flagellar basal-body MS-ring/collar protein FliF, partial [Geminicoccaceae bacterium]|nr:flagellar basal-body MS-ring/collar protein FliF [Geminicoccaceae bacterium]